MEQLIISSYVLALLFFVVAFSYSSVGLGGGSSYTALMAIFGVSFLAIPTISLTLNLLVTSVGSFNFVRKRHARIKLILPFFITSIPALNDLINILEELENISAINEPMFLKAVMASHLNLRCLSGGTRY